MIECRQIPGHPLYYAGSDGSLWSRRRPNHRVGSARRLCPALTQDGYLRTSVNEGGRSISFLAHRLVALAFLGSCPEGFTVNHKNGDKLDNSPGNLEYVSIAGNVKHAYANGLMALGTRRPRSKLNDDKVRDIRRRHASGETAMRPLAREYGVSCGVVDSVIHRKTWKHVGEEVCK